MPYANRERGSAIVAVLAVVSAIVIFSLALLTSGLSGTKSVNHHVDKYSLSSAVESVAILAAEDIWSSYLAHDDGAADPNSKKPGAAGDLTSFRNYLTNQLTIPDQGPGGPPGAEEGVDMLGLLSIPGYDSNKARFANVNVDSVRVYRRDEGEATQLYITISASTTRGEGFANPVLNRSTQQVYTIQPEEFEGFEYGMLTNNVNCIFCHTQVDSVERYYNNDPDQYGTFDKIKVGTMESLQIRHHMYGTMGLPNDGDADSYIAGTVYSRGTAVDHAGNPISSWSDLTFGGFQFDAYGKLAEDSWGALTSVALSPAGNPPSAGENLYLNYPTNYADMVDGKMPTMFPPPIADDGGFDVALGGPVPGAAGNKQLDAAEFYKASQNANGAITAGIITVIPEGLQIKTLETYGFAMNTGTHTGVGLQQYVDGNTILTGTVAQPITIQGTVAIDGDLVISGYVKGEGSLLVKGNVYMPSDVVYLDGKTYLEGDTPGDPTGPITFGVGQDGKKNALGIAAGGNIVIGDFQAPNKLQADGSWNLISPFDYVSGDPGGGWSFTLSELSLFNQGEWSKTQPMLPGPGENSLDPSLWSVANEGYLGPEYIPRYYAYNEGGLIPVYNKGEAYFNGATQSWMVDDITQEIPLDWNGQLPGYDLLTEIDPSNPLHQTDFLSGFGPDGTSNAVISTITPTGGWIDPSIYQFVVTAMQALHLPSTPLQVDGLLYSNNALFGIVGRFSKMQGQMLVNGALVAADLGLFVPSSWNGPGNGTTENPPGSPFRVGLQLNYDKRVKKMLNVSNPNQVQIKRTLWNPSANILASYSGGGGPTP